MFEFQIDNGSILNAGAGQVQAALVLVNSSATAGNGEFYGDGSATEVISIDSNSFAYTPGVDNSAAACTWEDFAQSGRVSGDYATRATNADQCGDASTILNSGGTATCPVAQASFVAGQATSYRVWVRIYRPDSSSSPSAHNELHIGIDGDVSISTLKDFWHGGPDDAWRFENITPPTSVARETGALTAGSHTIEVYPYDQTMKFSKVVLTPDTSYTPGTVGTVSTNGNDHNLGPAESPQSVSSIDDNPANPIAPGAPVPGTTITPDEYYPAVSAPSVPLNGLIARVVVTNGTQANCQSFTVVDGTDPIAGSYSANGDRLIFTSSDLLIAGRTYTAHAIGSLLDSTGALKGIDETWTFTAANVSW